MLLSSLLMTVTAGTGAASNASVEFPSHQYSSENLRGMTLPATPPITVDGSYELEKLDPQAGEVEGQYHCQYESWSNEELLAHWFEVQKPVETKHELITVPGFFHMPREAEEKPLSDWSDSKGNLLQKSLRRSSESWEEHYTKLDSFTEKAKELGWSVATLMLVRHATTVHNTMPKQWPGLQEHGLHPIMLTHTDTSISTPETVWRDPNDPQALDGKSQCAKTRELLKRNKAEGMREYPISFVTPHKRTVETDAWVSMAPSAPIVVYENREQTGSHISDRHDPLSDLTALHPDIIIPADTPIHDSQWMSRRVLNRLGLYAERLGISHPRSMHPSKSEEETEMIKKLAEECGSNALDDGFDRLSDISWHREPWKSVTRRSRKGDGVVLDVLSTTEEKGATINGHGTSLHRKLIDWFESPSPSSSDTSANANPNAPLLSHSTCLDTLIAAFGQKYAHLFSEHTDGVARAPPTKLAHAEVRPVVVLYRLKEGQVADTTVGKLWMEKQSSRGSVDASGSGATTREQNPQLP